MKNSKFHRLYKKYLRKCEAMTFVFCGLLILLTPFARQAQGADFLSQAYVFVAPGLMTHEQTVFGTLQFGGGGERFVYRKLAVGAEIGYLGIFDPPSFLHPPGNNFGLLSLNASYIKPKGEKLVPFVIGGYSLGFRDGSASFINIGGGATYWAKKHTGIRLELRDYFYPHDANDHHLGLRVGLALR